MGGETVSAVVGIAMLKCCSAILTVLKKHLEVDFKALKLLTILNALTYDLKAYNNIYI
jgi:hypothetical protein